MITQRLTIPSGSGTSSVDEVNDKRQLVGIEFPAMNGTLTFVIEQLAIDGLTWIEVYTSANVLFNPAFTASKVIPIPQEIGSCIKRYRIKVPTNQSADRVLVGLVK